MHKFMDFPLPQRALPWLLLSQLGGLLLHTSYLPISLWVLVVLFMGWRWLVQLGRLPHPSRALKGLAVLFTVAVLVLNIRGFNLESAGTFLIATSLLKIIELRTLRDGYVLVFLNLFVLATGFLFNQDMLAAAWAIVLVNLLIVALISLHYSAQSRASSRELIGQAAKLMLLSLPMMLVLYLLFPRFGPLWSFTLQSDQAKTGLSNDMAVGDIAELSQSAELAFRASFIQEQLPSREQLYWRALVLDHYDGKRWTASIGNGSGQRVDWYSSAAHSPQELQHSAQSLQYEIIQEPTGKNWLFALDYPQAIEPRTGVTHDYRLVARRPVHQRLRYNVLSSPLENAIIPLSSWQERSYLQLPRQANQQARAWGEQLAKLAPEEAAQSIMQRFASDNFYYTLKPQRYGENEVDEFLFARQQGFCAHYAGAMVFVARSAGIPARVVTGYQGGEWNAKEHYLTVRQYDAHAWVELWFAERGWVRFDPTAMVSADRILFGLEQAVAEEGTFLAGQFNLSRFKRVSWLNQMRLWADNMEYVWQKWVLSYDNERQNSFLQDVLKLKDYQQGLYIIAASFVAFFLFASLVLWWRMRPTPLPPLLKAWHKLQILGEKRGVEINTGETLGNYMQRLAQHFPELKEGIDELTRWANKLLYQHDILSKEDELQLAKRLNQLRKHLSHQAQLAKPDNN